AYWMPPILQRVQSSGQIEYLPAKSRPSLQINTSGVQAQVFHEIPFKAQRIGAVNLPPLKVQYFDPDTGRIETIYHQIPSPTAWNIPIIAVITGLIVIFLLKIGKWSVRQHIRYTEQQSAIQTVSQAQSSQELVHGLRRYALAEGWPWNLTLSAFLSLWEQRYDVSAEFKASLQSLSRSLYGGVSDCSLIELQTSLLPQLRRRKRRRRLPPRLKNTTWGNKNMFIPN
ncbi:hypothetical protein, partial [Kaarinaea lacus]